MKIIKRPEGKQTFRAFSGHQLKTNEKTKELLQGIERQDNTGQMKEERVYSTIDLYRKHMFFK